MNSVQFEFVRIYLFYTGQNTKYFGLKFFTAVEIVMFYAYDFFHIFFETEKCGFQNFQKTGLPGAREPKKNRSPLDRFFCTTDFDQIFPLATVQALPRVGGDHTPVLWDSGCATPPKASSYKMEK